MYDFGALVGRKNPAKEDSLGKLPITRLTRILRAVAYFVCITPRPTLYSFKKTTNSENDKFICRSYNQLRNVSEA